MTETYHHGNLRKELINSGLKMLNRSGIASFSLRKLSTELGVSHTAAYRHFKDREELLKAILIESSLMFQKALESSVKPGTEGEEALMQLGSGYIHFFLDNPEILHLFAMMPSEQNLLISILKDTDRSHLNSDLETLSRHRSFGIFRETVSAAKKNKLYTGLSEQEILLGFWSKVHGITTILITQKNFIPADKLDEVIERVLRTPF